MAIAHHLTYADLLDMPEERRELLGGELHGAASPSKRHQRVVRELGAYLVAAMRAGFGEVWYAPFDVYLDAHNVVQPDLLFVRAGREAIVQENKVVGVPDLAVEILSPSTAAIDLGWGPKGKLGTYERFGVPYYWIVDPDEFWIDVYAANAAEEGRYPHQPVRYGPGEVLTTPLFPELPLHLAELFW
jgi:Uma2 family endonuclease